MISPRRFTAVLVVGVVLAVGGVAVVHETTPDPVQAEDVPVLEPTPTTTTTTTTPVTEPEALPAEPQTPPDNGGGRRPVAVPKDEYAPEPIVQIGTIEIPKLGVRQTIYHGITMRNINLGPSHWPGTPFPGENGNTVFAGHRVTKTRPFRNIDKLVPGDLVHFTVNGVRTTYAMTSNEIVTPKGMHIIDPTPTPTATLFACHPPGSARYRFVVKLALVEG